MFVLKRNQVIITALVIMVAVAGFLTWNDSRQPESIGYLLTDQGEIAALIPDGAVLTGLFPDIYYGTGDLPWVVTHDPTIALGDGYAWPALAGLDLDYRNTEAGEAIFVNRSLESSFFVQARLNREQGRSQERAILTELINNNNVEGDQRARAADAMLELQRRIEREAAAESLIESKGFSEVYVRISEDAVDVVVSKDELSPGELAQIMDIVKRKAGVAESNIFISPMRR
jgi:stage III sporulation protein AH